MLNRQPIAIVGMACVYPDARSPQELWENILAQRQAFRRIPSCRLNAGDYLCDDRSAPDKTYIAHAAVIEGYEFDRVAFRVAGSTFRSADLAHWLALDVASRALADAAFAHGEGLPREMTGCILGNTLTGEFSRAGLMRLRWPYVRRVVESALAEHGWDAGRRHSFIEALETEYKSPFPPVGEESLAGGLSNTIAGRICNHFDLKGGGYTVDGACASSLLATANACSALAAGDLDVALAGGVDLSLDPFEIVGFAKTSALARDTMRVYDARSAGFWPGEGCGFAVLMRYEDAIATGRRVYAVIQGWGLSSDGSGGITRPEAEGQMQALHRAYRRAGYGVDTVGYFEGHGTGTSVGDATELQSLSRARHEASQTAPPAAIGSIKANIGHTKAAAGIAGLLKGALAIHTQILPPITGCQRPAKELIHGPAPWRILREVEPWPEGRPLRAGVSAMGFGGINAHITLESVSALRRKQFGARELGLARSAQDAELFLFAENDFESLSAKAAKLASFAACLSLSELADLSAELANLFESKRFRAAIVASTPAELASRLATLISWIREEVPSKLDIQAGIFFGAAATTPRIGFLFPGQASPAHLDGGLHRRRFETVRSIYNHTPWAAGADPVATEVAQPGIATASLASLRLLKAVGIEASAGLGHSLGELAALHWAGAFDEAALLRIAGFRGQAMARAGNSAGAMAAIGADASAVAALLSSGVSIAGYNSPHQTVVAGDENEVNSLVAQARHRGWTAVKLAVSNAFHTNHVSAAIPMLADGLSREHLSPLRRRVFSTITGGELDANEDLGSLLLQQVTSPVKFQDALAAAAATVDLFIEAGPGEVLSGLAHDSISNPVVALDTGGDSIAGLLKAVGAAFALGCPICTKALYEGRFVRPFNLDWHPKFFANPCELAPAINDAAPKPVASVSTVAENGAEYRNGSLAPKPAGQDAAPASNGNDSRPVLEVVRQLVACRAELPEASVSASSSMLGDLHLNSISVGQLVSEAAVRLHLPPPIGLTDFANATVGQIAQALEELRGHERNYTGREAAQIIPGVDTWVSPFTIEWVETRRTAKKSDADKNPAKTQKCWQIITIAGHPLESSLRQIFNTLPGNGAVVCLPTEANDTVLKLALEGAKIAAEQGSPARFILVQHGWGAAGFARTLHLESPTTPVCIIDVPFDHPEAAKWVADEAKNLNGFCEVRYDSNGLRREPRLKTCALPSGSGELSLGPEDVLLVTGGGKGIACECALSLARRTGARLALLGRSRPEADAELAENLRRFEAAGIRFQYFTADVTDGDAVNSALAEARKNLGKITAFLHAAGINTPKLITSLDEAAFQKTLAPKIKGARNVLAAVGGELRLFASFGSIIGRAGLAGEADYALANEWLACLTEDFAQAHPETRCLAVEWSVWSGVGMGARLGRLEALRQQGITPIPPEQGTALFERLLAHRLPVTTVVVSGRFGEMPTLKLAKPELPLFRFLENPRIYYPGVELVAESTLSAESDPYIEEHIYHGERLFPAVVGLEAMAQAAIALQGSKTPPHFEKVEFNRPVVIPRGGKAVIRVAALIRNPREVETVLRTEGTAFQIDHFRAICRFAAETKSLNSPEPQGKREVGRFKCRRVPLEIGPDIYNDLLFHSGRFVRVGNYRFLRAKECVAQLHPDAETGWFGAYLPGTCVLGDAGVRDAAIHAIQASIPHARLLPAGVGRILIGKLPCLAERSRTAQQPPELLLRASQQRREGDTFYYDLELLGDDGTLLERWEGLQLRKVEDIGHNSPWPEPLLGPYIERRLEELLPGSEFAVILQKDMTSAEAIQEALGAPSPVRHRPDGKPEEAGGRGISTAHTAAFTLAVAGSKPIGCDLETVLPRTQEVWRSLLGLERFNLALQIACESGETFDTAATRAWTVVECLKKGGQPAEAPAVLEKVYKDGWITLHSGTCAIATYVASVKNLQEPLAIGVLGQRIY